MAAHPRLVNKQFNSPIGLYSQQNVQEVLEREAQILANGAVGINFHNPDVGKPANLKNSAVLRMLEEEENRQRNGFGPGNDHIARPLRENISWPPPEYEHKNSLRSTFKDVVIPGAKRVAWPPPNESGLDSPYVEQNSVSSQGGPQYPSQSLGLQQNNYQAPAQQQPVSHNPPSHRPLKPLDVSTGGSSPLVSPLVNQSPQSFRSATPVKGWAPVHSPVTTPTQPSWQSHSPSVAAPSQPSWQQSAPSAVAPSQPSWRQSAPQNQQQSSATHFQAAHQSVSQHTYLGQQYAASPYQPPQQQYQPPQQQYQAPPQQYQPPQQQYQPPQQQYQPPQQQYQPPPQQYQPPQQQYQPPQQQYQPPQQQYQPPQQQPPQQQYQPPQQYQPSQQQYQTPQQQYQTPQQQYQAPPQQYQASSQLNQAPQSSPKPAAAPSQVAPRVQSAPASKPLEPPPSTITLRQTAPVSQAPPPVVTSQPATATLKVKVGQKHLRGDQKWPPEDVKKKIEEENVDSNDSFLSIQGGKHLRGDLKWPPENVKIQVEEENRLRLELAKGPVFRPRRPNKDYTEFFEQHALNSTYPGYKIPPGTQFYRPV